MTVTVASSDVSNFNLQAQITAVTAAIAANVNPAILFSLQQLQTQLQSQLLQSLIANYQNRGNSQMGQGSTSWINPATALSSLTINA